MAIIVQLMKKPIKRSAFQFALTAIAFIGLVSYSDQVPAQAQCTGSAVTTPVTINDESQISPNSRRMQSGQGTTVDVSTPNVIKINANLPVPGSSSIPQKRVGTWSPILTTSTTFTAVNITAPTVNTAGTVANNSGSSGILIKYPTTASSGNAAGVHSTAFTDTEYQMSPIYACRIQTGSSISTQRIWVGLAAAALSGSATPAVNSAAFRFDTGASDTTFQCYTSNGSTNTITNTGVTVAASSTYDLAIDMSNSSQILFYINGNLVATNTTNLPGASTALGPVMTITTLTTTAENFSLGTMRLESY